MRWKDVITIIDYKVKELREKLEKQIVAYDNELSLLSSIYVATKKDGTEYANLVKGFRNNNPQFTNFRVLRDEDNRFTVSAYLNDTYVNVDVYGYENLTYDYTEQKYVTPTGVDEDRVLGGGWRVPYYLLNTDELNERIKGMYNARLVWKREAMNKLKNIDTMVEILSDTARKLNALGDIPYGWKDCIH